MVARLALRRRSALTVLLPLSLAGCLGPGPEVNGPPQQVASSNEGALGPYLCDGIEIRAQGEGAERIFCAHESPLAWESAERACRERGGHLATFESTEEGRRVAAAFGSRVGLSGRFWFGLAETREDAWLWVSSEAPSFGNWAQGEPNNAGGDEGCAEWLTQSGAWNDLPCDRALPYVCERLPREEPGQEAPALSCTGTQVLGGNKEYCFFTSSPKQWMEAQNACMGAGGRLAMPRSAQENEDLRKAVSPLLSSPTVWIGASDTQSEGTWLSPLGAPVTATSWGPGEPNNQGDEDCAEMVLSSGAWNDLHCTTPRPFLCEKAYAP